MFLRSILCPVDFSEQSRQALRLAGLFAGRFQSRLVVLSVVDPLLAEAAKARLKLDLVKKETRPALAAFVKETWSGMAVATTTSFERRRGPIRSPTSTPVRMTRYSSMTA